MRVFLVLPSIMMMSVCMYMDEAVSLRREPKRATLNNLGHPARPGNLCPWFF
ncbi:hypothetical protein BX666DRAFT_2000380 [Dichotomocladium elegans]|nr:hypothetical protein BX666DRAFT_2000380 [Dichotomocladium elegans]